MIRGTVAARLCLGLKGGALMTQVLAAGISILALLIASALWLKWRERHHEAQCLAEALIGEITAVLETIEVQRLVDKLQNGANGDSENPNVGAFALPHLMVFEANAGRLDHLEAPIQRLVSQLFDRFAALPIEVGTLRDTAALLTEDGGPRARVLESLNQSLRLADEALLALRPIANPRSRAHHLA